MYVFEMRSIKNIRECTSANVKVLLNNFAKYP